MITKILDHFLQEVVDLVLSATEVSTLDRVVGLLSPSPSWVVQLEGSQEVGGVLEVWSNSENLVDQILNTDNSHLARLVLNNVVGGDWSSVSIDLDKSTFVDEITNSLQVGGPVGNVGLADPEHVGGGLVHLDEHSVVDLPQSEQLKDLPDLGRDLVDTADPHHEGQLRLGRDVVVSVLLGIALKPDLVPLLILVLLGILLSTLEDGNTLLPLVHLGLHGELGPVGPVLSLPLATLEDCLWDSGELGVGHSSLVEVNQAILAW